LRELKEANKPQAALNVQKQHQKQMSKYLLTSKSPKTPFLTQKCFIRFTSKMVFQPYFNLKKFLLLTRIIPVQSLVSNLCPLPSGLGLIYQSSNEAKYYTCALE
jgi:hypothetical protein